MIHPQQYSYPYYGGMQLPIQYVDAIQLANLMQINNSQANGMQAHAEKTNSTRFGTSRSPHSPDNLKNSAIGVANPINMDMSQTSIQNMNKNPLNSMPTEPD